MKTPKKSKIPDTSGGQISEHLKLFSKLSIDALKELASKGQELTSDSLFSTLKSRKEIKALAQKEKSLQLPKESVGASPEIDTLKSQIKLAKTQKDQIVKQLDELEESKEELDRFYKRVLLTFSGLLYAPENDAIHGSLSHLKTLLKKKTDFLKLEEAFKNIKDAALKTGLKKEKRENKTKPYSFFTKFLKSSLSGIDEETFNANYLKQLKDSYQEIMDELKLSLSQDYLKKIIRIEARIAQADSIDDLHMVRGDILSLIHEYVVQISSERERTASFIQEIGQRLMDVENFLIDSMSEAQKIHSENKDFNSLLKNNFQGLRKDINYSKTLDELKQAVVKTLTTIEDALENKNKEDMVRMEAAEKKAETLKKYLIHTKKEMAAAQDLAVSLEKEAHIDSLTGVYNRRAYDRRIKEEMERYFRYRRPFSLLLLDVDHFKKINDTYGHAIGDKCLKEIINIIQPNIRETDFLGRIGGEEFTVILPETESNNAKTVAEKLRQIIEKIEFLHKEDTVKITISIGVSQAASSDKDTETLFDRVDSALYKAKNTGRNKVVSV